MLAYSFINFSVVKLRYNQLLLCIALHCLLRLYYVALSMVLKLHCYMLSVITTLGGNNHIKASFFFRTLLLGVPHSG